MITVENRNQFFESLNILTLNINQGVSGRYDEISSPEDAELLERCDLLTTYLVQKSFVTSLRTLVKSQELVEKYQSMSLSDVAKSLEFLTKQYFLEIYSYESVNEQGILINHTGENLYSFLLEMIAIPVRDENLKTETLIDQLLGYQNKYVDLIVELVSKRSAEAQTIGWGSFSVEIEKRLRNLEKQNFDNIKDKFKKKKDKEPQARLSDFTERDRSKITSDLMNRIDAEVDSIVSREPGQSDNDAVRIWDRLLKWRKKDIEIVAQDVIGTEKFICSVRESINRLQQLLVLTNVLDSINELYVSICSVENGLDAALLEQQSERKSIEANDLLKQTDELKSTQNQHNHMIAEMGMKLANRKKATADQTKNLALAKRDISISLDKLDPYFKGRSQHVNDSVIILSKLSNAARALHPQIIQEAGESKAPFISEFIRQIQAAIGTVRKSRDDYTRLSPPARETNS